MKCCLLEEARLGVAVVGCAAVIAGCSEKEGQESHPTWASYYLDQCAQISACTGQPLASCFGDFYRDDFWEAEIFALSDLLELRRQCLEDAADCATVEACMAQAEAAMQAALQKAPTAVTCGQEEEVLCAGGELVWCFKGEYDAQARPILFELDDVGKTCNTKGTYAADPGHVTCNAEVSEGGLIPLSESCDGPFLKYCADGELLTWDCRDIDPDFRCVYRHDDQVHCGLPLQTQQCEEGNYFNSGNSATCEGDVAQVCAGGKLFAVDCASVPGATCEEREPGAARCVLPEP